MWASKFAAALKHGLITLLVAIVAYIVVFHMWYPDVMSQLMPGTKLFLLVLGVEVVLGPCMSLVIFNKAKSARELILDYAFVGSIQCAALIYGIHSVADSRPVFVVFVKDRLEVVSAVEISEFDFMEASEELYQQASWFGPKLVCSRDVLDAEEKKRLLFEEIPSGKDVRNLPRFYRSCRDSELFDGGGKMKQLEDVIRLKSVANIDIDRKLLSDKYTWMPVVGKMGAWAAIIDVASPEPIGYIKVDPFL